MDHPVLDLDQHAREVVRGAASLANDARARMVAAMTRYDTASDRTVALWYLQYRGERR